jgi:hypothetical protein
LLSLLTMVKGGKTRIAMGMILSLDRLQGEASFVCFAVSQLRRMT